MLEYSYLDYAGESITEAVATGASTSDEGLFEIYEEAEEADAILVLLDGHKLLYAMEGRDHPAGPIHVDLNHVLPIVTRLNQRPTHFVITKWDILEGKFSLEQVRTWLLRNDAKFNSTVQQLIQQHYPVRLIPVSAVGKGFAELASDGTMLKKGIPRARPEYVEMPIACTLLDAFEGRVNQLQREQRELLGREPGGGRKFLVQVLHVAKDVTSAFPLPDQYNLPRGAVILIMSILNAQVESTIEDLKAERDTLVNSIRSHEDATKSLVVNNLMLMRLLEREFPASNLSKL